MKKFIVICIFATLIIQDIKCAMTEAQLKNALKMIRNVCQPKMKVTNAQLEAMHQGQFTEDAALMCYMECVLRTGQIVKDGKINEESLRSQLANLPPNLAEFTKNAVERCRNLLEKGNDKCKAAYEVYKCFYDFNSENFFLP